MGLGGDGLSGLELLEVLLERLGFLGMLGLELLGGGGLGRAWAAGFVRG